MRRWRLSIDVVGAALFAALGCTEGCGGVAGGGPAAIHRPPPPCTNPTPVVVNGVDTATVTCADGRTIRPSPVTCPSVVPRAGTTCVATDGGSAYCWTDSDCPQPNGYCASFMIAPAGTECACGYGCVKDSDCSSTGDSICVCSGLVGNCWPAACSQCEPGYSCAKSTSYTFRCESPQDTCTTDADCANVAVPTSGYPTGAPGGCSFNGVPICAPANYSDATSPLICRSDVTCVTGRPFLVRGHERLAAAVERGDWAWTPARPELGGLAPELRERLAAHWTAVGRMEHASIAAFARFTLHLLALGAPPELVRASQQAMDDELGHARLAFGLASAYGARAIGPGPLGIEGALDGFDPREVVSTLIREGCIGETLAALEATSALEDAVDPAVRAVLHTIEREELRHAELAWRTLAWLVSTRRVRRDVVEREFETAQEEIASRAPAAPGANDLRAFGVLDEAERDELRRAALASIVDRCAHHVLAGGSGEIHSSELHAA
jgi:hypothetical protein